MALRDSEKGELRQGSLKIPKEQAAGGELREAVQAELNQVFLSSEFRQSEQSKRLLRYLVEHSFEGDQEALRERAIGVALFGLQSGYDTSENPIVRVRANEVRKRLGKYYKGLQETPKLILNIPSGGYRVEFRIPEAEVAESHSVPVGTPDAAPPAPEQPKRLTASKRVKFGIAATVVFCLAASALPWMLAPDDVLADFWAPALAADSPVIICSGNPVVYALTAEFHSKVRGGPTTPYQRLTEPLLLKPDQPLFGRDISPVTDQYVGLGSADAVARIHGWLARNGKDSEIRFGNDLSFNELRKAPAVLIGAFQNRWAIEFTRNLPIVFETVDGRVGIRDTVAGKTLTLNKLGRDGRTTEDYVLISRVFNRESGQFVIMGAGLTQYGTRTSGEILSGQKILQQALEGVESGWQERNVQILFHVPVIGQTSGAPEYMARHVW